MVISVSPVERERLLAISPTDMQTEYKSLNTQCFPEDYTLIEGQVNIDKGKSGHAISLPSFHSLSFLCLFLLALDNWMQTPLTYSLAGVCVKDK